MGLMEDLRMVRQYLGEAETVYDRLKGRGEPSPLMIALPMLYQRFVAQNEPRNALDEKFLTFASHYLATRFPEVKEYFLNDQHQQRIQAFHETLDRFFDEKRAEGIRALEDRA